ncbi:MAG TPA: alpha/beta hydrolase-fold protein, partial [Bacteroidales bacterium]|nr:alpha/beta hydrolase-fold protein [Bacteroidales bacterium]
QEYLPAPAFNLLPADYKLHLKGEHNNPDLEPLSDSYLAFIVKELKPYIDKNYSTLRGPEDTVIMGSSMGGLISAYALACYPQVFGGAGCLSTHWPLSLHEQNDLISQTPIFIGSKRIFPRQESTICISILAQKPLTNLMNYTSNK